MTLASPSGISIQHRYDLKNQKSDALDIYPVISSDNGYALQIQPKENVLVKSKNAACS